MGQLAIGYDYGEYRAEGGFYGLLGTLTIGDVDYTAFISSILVSAYYDFGLPEARVSPYIGAGLGYGIVGVTDGSTTVTSPGGFSYRISTGLNYAFSDSWYGNLQGGYHGVSLEEGSGGRFGLGLGLGYRF